MLFNASIEAISASLGTCTCACASSCLAVLQTLSTGRKPELQVCFSRLIWGQRRRTRNIRVRLIEPELLKLCV